MRSHLECWPCFLEQALRAARLAGLGDEDTRRVLNQVGSRLAAFDPADPPPKHGRYLYRTIAELSRKPDPYAEVKHRHTATALALLPRLRRFAGAAPDPLDAAMRIAAAGNTLDLGAQPQTGDLEQALDRALHHEHARWEIEDLRRVLGRALRVLVLGDNAGETVFDRAMLEVLRRQRPGAAFSYAVREAPVINDATLEDAREAGLEAVATLLSTGCDAPGVLLDEVSPLFLKIFRQADLVLSKGQGNFETLDGAPRDLFFLLTVKCRIVARHLGLPSGSSVLLQGLP